jgi:hypothetical protein
MEIEELKQKNVIMRVLLKMVKAWNRLLRKQLDDFNPMRPNGFGLQDISSTSRNLSRCITLMFQDNNKKPVFKVI